MYIQFNLYYLLFIIFIIYKYNIKEYLFLLILMKYFIAYNILNDNIYIDYL